MRPLPITILAAVLTLVFAGNLVSVVVTLSSGLFSIGRELWIVVTNLVGAISIVELWRMRRWGPTLYLGGYLVGVLTAIAWPPPGGEVYASAWAVGLMLIVPLIYAVVALPYWKRMSWAV